MATFSYQAINIDGGETTGKVEAGNLAAAVDRVRTQGLFPSSITPDVDSLGLTGLLTSLSFRKKPREIELAHFSRELADFINSGVPLPLSLSVLSDRQQSGRLKNILRELADDVRAGAGLSKAMEKHKSFFGEIYLQAIRTSEKTGKLDAALSGLADLKHKQRTYSQAIRKAIRQPKNILAFSLILFLYLYVLAYPLLLMSVYGWRWRRVTPWPIAITDDLIAICKNFFWPVLISGIFIYIVAKLLLRVKSIRTIRDSIILKLPIFGKISRRIAAAQFARPLCMLISLGISFPDALRIAKNAIGNLAITKDVKRVASDIGTGDDPEQTLDRLAFISPLVATMISMGAKTDGAEELLRKAAKTCDDRAEAAVTGFSKSLAFVFKVIPFVLATWFFLVLLVMTAGRGGLFYL